MAGRERPKIIRRTRWSRGKPGTTRGRRDRENNPEMKITNFARANNTHTSIGELRRNHVFREHDGRTYEIAYDAHTTNRNEAASSSSTAWHGRNRRNR